MPDNTLQAIVLAGGFGSRLSPLTQIKPKPLMKILDTPVIECVINSVRRTSSTLITVSTHYKHDMIEKTCGKIDKSICCNHEQIPLGTAGGVKNCYDGNSSNVLVVSGDAVFDFDLQKAVDFHIENKNDVTIVTCHKENPTELGTVMCDDDGNITSFIEKPAWKNVETDLVNTGIYVLSKQVIDRIPDNIKYDFSKNLFPKLLAEGRKLVSFACDGFWCDIGTLDEYFNCNMKAAQDSILTIVNTGEKPETLLCRSVHTDKSSYVSQTSQIGKNVKITSSVVCRNTNICENCDISDSVVGENCFIGRGSSVSFAIVGENVSIGENCIVPEGCVIGDGTRISDGTRLKKYTKASAGSALSKEDKSTMDFSKNTNVFKDDAVAVFDTKDLNYYIAQFGKALVINAKKWQGHRPVIAVMCDEKSEYAKTALLSGLQMTGAKIYDFGVGKQPAMLHVSHAVECDASVYLYTSECKIEAKVFDDKCGMIDSDEERKISKLYTAVVDDENDDAAQTSRGDVIEIPATEMYKTHLVKLARSLLNNVNLYTVQVHSMDELLYDVFLSLGCDMTPVSSPTSLSFDVCDNMAKIRRTTLILDHYHICALILKNTDYLPGVEIKVPENYPTVIKKLISSQIHSSTNQIVDISDPYTCLVTLVCIINVSGKSFEELSKTLPSFEIYNDEYVADINRAATMEKLSRLYSDTKNTDTDGIRLQMADGNVTVVPNRAKGFKIMAEAVNMETAKELSFKIGEIIKG